jgi:hypothetical protein
MFQQTGEALLRWATEVLGEGVARLGPPPVSPTGRGVSLYLLDITPRAPADAERYRRLRATLRYAAIAWAESTATANQLLDDLLFAARQHPLVRLERERPPADLWHALGMAPGPAVLFSCEAHHELSPRCAPPHLRTIYATTPASHLSGRVVGADGRAVDRATVAVPKYEMHAKTDDAGRFTLPALPSQEPVTIVVHANGREEQLRLVQAGGRAAGVVIQLGS